MVRTVVLLLSVSVILLGGARGFAQDNVAFAQQRFARGVQLYDAGDYGQAATEFEASLQLYESPNSRLYLARAYSKLAKLGEAMTEYQRAERESADRAAVDPRYAATRDVAAAAIEELRPRVARVVVKVSPGPKVIEARVAGRRVPQAALGLPIAVTPGRVEVKVSAPGHLPFQQDMPIAAGEQAVVYVTLVAAESQAQQRAARWRWGGWLTAGVGAAALAAGGVFGLLAQKQYHDLVSSCGFAACVPAQPDAVARGHRWERLMDVSLITGGVAIVGGGMMLLLGRHLGARGDDGEESAHASLGDHQLTLGWTGRAVILQGRF